MKLTDYIFDLIKQRRTVHSYLEAPLNRELLLQAVEAASWAPNHKLTHPLQLWRMGQQTRQKIIELQASEQAKEKLRIQLLPPSEILVLGLKRVDDPFQAREDYASVACSVQNMALYFQAHGFYSKWGTGALTRELSTYQILGIKPEQFEIVGFFYVGKPAKIPDPVHRLPVNEILTELP